MGRSKLFDNKDDTDHLNTDTLILQLGCILHTVPSWKKAYDLRVAVFVEYESDVEEERGRVKSLLENLRIEAEVLVFWLASGDLPTYEVIVNGQSPGQDVEKEVDDCLKGQDWWDEIQTIRGKRNTSGSQDLADVASIFTTASAWPTAIYQQGPRNERWKRFMGLRKMMKKSKRRQTMSGLSKLGVSLNMRTQNLIPNVTSEHPGILSASEESESESDSDAIESDSDAVSDRPESVVSEADKSDYESESEPEIRTPKKISRRRSHGDSMRGPPPSKRATGEREPKVPEAVSRKPASLNGVDWSGDARPSTPGPDRPKTADSSKQSSISNLTNSINSLLETPVKALDGPQVNAFGLDVTPKQLEQRFTALRQPSPRSPILPPTLGPTIPPSPSRAASADRPAPSSRRPSSNRPDLSRHASQPRFSSKPVPVAKVATEDGPGPSIMFTDTPSPPNRHRNNRLPSAYRPRDEIAEVSEAEEDAIEPSSRRTRSRAGSLLSQRGSTYSTSHIPLSFNDLPCRAQHLMLNELMRNQSADAAVMLTTLPSPVEGTSKSEEACVAYLSDLEVLTKGLPPVMLVHSNSMTVTMSL